MGWQGRPSACRSAANYWHPGAKPPDGSPALTLSPPEPLCKPRCCWGRRFCTGWPTAAPAGSVPVALAQQAPGLLQPGLCRKPARPQARRRPQRLVTVTCDPWPVMTPLVPALPLAPRATLHGPCSHESRRSLAWPLEALVLSCAFAAPSLAASPLSWPSAACSPRPGPRRRCQQPVLRARRRSGVAGTPVPPGEPMQLAHAVACTHLGNRGHSPAKVALLGLPRRPAHTRTPWKATPKAHQGRHAAKLRCPANTQRALTPPHCTAPTVVLQSAKCQAHSQACALCTLQAPTR